MKMNSNGTKVAAVLGTEGGVCFTADGFTDAHALIGQNTGNSLFQYAVWRLLKGPKFCVTSDMDPQRVREIADVLVIPAANQLNPNFNLTAWAEFIEAVDLPCRVVGLGAQAEGIDATPQALQLPEGVIRFAHAIAARTEKIGVRGEFTRQVLSAIGIHNTVITGCPSITINRSVCGASIAGSLNHARETSRLVVAVLGGTMQEYTRPTERILYGAVKDLEQHIVVYQTGAKLMRFLIENTLADDATASIAWMNKLVRPDLTLAQFFHYIVMHGRCYSDARSWIDAMRRINVAVGMRIHGAMAAIQAGTAGICVAFDSRTLELSQTLGIPYIPAPDLKPGMTISDIVDCVVFDPAGFDERKSKNSAAITEVLGDLAK